MNNISQNAIILPNVKLGKNCIIEDFCVIGKTGKNSQNKKTIIGDNAHIRTGTVIYAGIKIGNNFRTGDGAKIYENNKFGNNVTIGSNSIILNNCSLSDNISIHALVELAEHTKIKENSWIGPGVKMANMIHPKRYNCQDKKACEKRGAPKIGKEVRIGANATIGAFVTIGDNAIVASGANVISNIAKQTVAVGNPAKSIKKTDKIVCRYDKNNFPYRK
ncbi:MAG: DapH/DapD/GlmU-related protein [bacterium]